MIEVYLFTIVIVGLLWGWLIGYSKSNRIVYTATWGNVPKEEE
jgi:hypothetical protein